MRLFVIVSFLISWSTSLQNNLVILVDLSSIRTPLVLLSTTLILRHRIPSMVGDMLVLLHYVSRANNRRVVGDNVVAHTASGSTYCAEPCAAHRACTTVSGQIPSSSNDLTSFFRSQIVKIYFIENIEFPKAFYFCFHRLRYQFLVESSCSSCIEL